MVFPPNGYALHTSSCCVVFCIFLFDTLNKLASEGASFGLFSTAPQVQTWSDRFHACQPSVRTYMRQKSRSLVLPMFAKLINTLVDVLFDRTDVPPITKTCRNIWGLGVW